jgi:hypothetical protein
MHDHALREAATKGVYAVIGEGLEDALNDCTAIG